MCSCSLIPSFSPYQNPPRFLKIDSDLTTRALEVLNLFNDLKKELEQAIQTIKDEDEELIEAEEAAQRSKAAQDQAAEVNSTSSRSRLTTPSVNSMIKFLSRLSPFHQHRINPGA